MASLEAEKIIDKINSLPQNARYFSLEFFPPKTDMGIQNLQRRLSRMARALRPLFVTVTWGAGGSTALKSLELAELCQRQLGLTTCLHLTCTNMSKQLLDDTLKEARDIGIRNILALRGDPPRGDEYKMWPEDLKGAEEFVWAEDLVRYIRKEHGDYFCIGVAGYPEGHVDESHPEVQDPHKDLPYLAKKVRAGADFIMTQLFYNVNAFSAYEQLVRELGEEELKEIPIIPGLMPIQSYQILKRVTGLSHAKIPPEIAKRIEENKNNDEEVKRVGLEVLTSIVEEIKSKATGQQGFHFYTLNLEKAVSLIIEQTGLLPLMTPDDPNSNAIDESFSALSISEMRSRKASIQVRSRRDSSAHNHINTDDDSIQVNSFPEQPSRRAALDISHGVGALGREATRDDFPNGRFGDARSPAYCEIDRYGASLHISPTAARAKWGSPTSRADVAQLFLKHLQGDPAVDQLPWSEGQISGETQLIEKELCALIEQKGWLSIASQPAVNGVKSSDPVLGWGPKGGFVFQKPFVEFWVPAEDWEKVLRPRLEKADVKAEVSWYATPCPDLDANGALPNGDAIPADEGPPVSPAFVSSSSLAKPHPGTTSDPSADGVTWGVFRSKEIVTPTIIEELSFKAWAEEAFRIWREWERCYAPASPAREVIRKCREDMWLVNVIGHRFQEEGFLWDVLLAA